MRNSRVENLPHALKPFGVHDVIAVTGAASTLADLGYVFEAGNDYYLDIALEGGDIRVTADGATAPTAAVGVKWLDGREYRVSAYTARRLKLISLAAVPVLQIQPVTV